MKRSTGHWHRVLYGSVADELPNMKRTHPINIVRPDSIAVNSASETVIMGDSD
jgi:hypothetical protein